MRPCATSFARIYGSVCGYGVNGGEVAAFYNAFAARFLLDVVEVAASFREMAGRFFCVAGK
jgi:hypothetical protein